MTSKKRHELITPSAGQRGMSDLHYAAYSGDSGALSQCLSAGMNPNDCDENGFGALHWLADMSATGGPRVEMFRELLSCGADTNLQSKDGTTPLMLACRAGSTCGDQLAVALLEAGANPALRSKDTTCLHDAISNPYLVGRLISAGALLFEKSSRGLTPLQEAELREYEFSDEVVNLLAAEVGKLTKR
jgi:ankyrin repeat protein